jgi:malate permease and related proteins
MENLILVVVFVMLGMLFNRLEAFPRDSAQTLNMFVLYVSLPALILVRVPKIVFSHEILIPFLISWGMLLFSVALVFLAARLWRWERSIVGVLLIAVPLGNTGFVGIPVIQAFFGEAGIPYLIIYDQLGTVMIFSTYGSLILATYGRSSSLNLPAVVRGILLFPPTIAFAVGLAARTWTYPAKLEQVLQNVSLTLVPLVMTAIGFQLRLRLPSRVISPLGFGLAVKLLAAPLTVLAACHLAGLSGRGVNVSIIEAGMPPMVMAGALAVVAGMDAELAVAMVGVGIVLSFATLPLLYWLMQQFL